MGGLDNHHELTLLSCCLLENRLIDRAVLDGLTRTWFTEDLYSVLWDGMATARQHGREVDITWANDYLKEKTGKVHTFLSNGIADIVTVTQFNSAFEIMKRQWLRRRLGRVFLEANQCLVLEEPLKIANKVIADLTEIREDTIAEQDDDIEAKIQNRISTGIKHSWGYDKLNHCTRGVEPYFYIIAGDSGHLKTTMALNLAYNVAEDSLPVHIFSGEMSGQLLYEKLAIMKSGMNTRYGIATEHRPFFMQCVKDVQELPIYINETVSLPRIRMEIAKKLCGVYIIDYLQLVQADVNTKSREREVSYVIEELARMRSDYKVCIIALSSLNRGDREKNNVPTLRNLKDSSSIEYGADYVWFMYYKWRVKTARDEKIDESEKCKLRTYLSKNRVYGYEERIDYEFNIQSLRLIEQEKYWVKED